MQAAKKKMLEDEETRRAEVRCRPRCCRALSAGGVRRHTVGVTAADNVFARLVGGRATQEIRKCCFN